MWNLEKWHRWSYLQTRNRDTDIENKHLDTKGGEVGGMNWEFGTDIYGTTDNMSKIVSAENLLNSAGDASQSSVVT